MLPFRASLAGWGNRNHVKFKGKCQALHLGRNNSMHQYWLDVNYLESTFAEENMEVLVDKLDVS